MGNETNIKGNILQLQQILLIFWWRWWYQQVTKNVSDILVAVVVSTGNNFILFVGYW
jgi:hypothetical protein